MREIGTNNIPTLQEGKQIYAAYTEEDFEVWQMLFNRQQQNLSRYFSSTYVGCMEAVGMANGKVPNFNSINKSLNKTTGWCLHGVEAIVDIEPFLTGMEAKRFPATTWVRSMAKLEYLEEPDMFHDVFGHVPLLAHKPYADFLHNLGVLGLKYAGKSGCLRMIQRMYWFTVEFGLIEEDFELKAYGAGLISSPGEIMHYLSDESEKRLFSVKEILNTEFRTDVYQNLYFVIKDFEQLYACLGEIEACLAN